MILGATYSHHQATWLDLKPVESLKAICTWPIKMIRLGAYWDEIEKEPGEYDFSKLIQQLEICQQTDKKVVLSLGIKAPRWPEFYFPDHVEPDINLPTTQAKARQFIQVTIQTIRSFNNISHWQIENEPLDPSGPHQQTIPLSFLQSEVDLVRQLDSRPIIINLWGNDLSTRGNLDQAAALADIVGIDLYYKQFMMNVLGKNIYAGPRDSANHLSEILTNSSKPAWIMELQAEPWEKDGAGYKKSNPGSFNVSQLQKNWQAAQKLPVEAVFFWGVEYWLWQQQQGNNQFVNWTKQLQTS